MFYNNNTECRVHETANRVASAWIMEVASLNRLIMKACEMSELFTFILLLSEGVPGAFFLDALF